MSKTATFAALIAVLSLGIAEVAGAQIAELGEELDASAPPVPPPKTFNYGSNRQQNLDFWPATSAQAPTPLIVFVHGGFWTQGSKDSATGRWKETHFPAQGYAFATINYRLVPGVKVEDEVADVASALKYLIDHAPDLGVDRARVVLMGHSAGAHLVTLVGTDERYLQSVGLGVDRLAGIVAIDGAAYDVVAQVAAVSAVASPMLGQYREAFGTEPARQHALSPVFHAQAPNVARFLLLRVQRPDGIHQTAMLAKALQEGGSQVQVGGFEGTGMIGHVTINRRLGDPGYPATPVVDEWLKKLFASP